MDAHTDAIESLRRDTNEQFESFRRDTNEQFESLRGEMNTRFEQVDQRFDRIDQRFEHVDRRMDGLEQRWEDKWNGLRILIESVQSDVKLVLEHLAPLMTRVADHETRITVLERRRRKPS